MGNRNSPVGWRQNSLLHSVSGGWALPGLGQRVERVTDFLQAQPLAGELLPPHFWQQPDRSARRECGVQLNPQKFVVLLLGIGYKLQLDRR